MTSPLFGKWKLEKSERFDEYMKAIGVDAAQRKLGAAVTSTTKILDEGEGKIRIRTKSSFKSSNDIFELGKENNEKTMDGRKCKTTLEWEGNEKLHQVQTWDEGKRRSTLDWIHENGKMIARLECDGVVCYRTHIRIEQKNK